MKLKKGARPAYSSPQAKAILPLCIKTDNLPLLVMSLLSKARTESHLNDSLDNGLICPQFKLCLMAFTVSQTLLSCLKETRKMSKNISFRHQDNIKSLEITNTRLRLKNKIKKKKSLYDYYIHHPTRAVKMEFLLPLNVEKS